MLHWLLASDSQSYDGGLRLETREGRATEWVVAGCDSRSAKGVSNFMLRELRGTFVREERNTSSELEAGEGGITVGRLVNHLEKPQAHLYTSNASMYAIVVQMSQKRRDITVGARDERGTRLSDGGRRKEAR